MLSLFFIDKVANYRWYDDEGNPQPGKYALWFEEEYANALMRDKSLTPDQRAARAAAAHGGYFAIDKRKDATGTGRLKESRGEGKTAADESAYALIMKDKERLLSFDTELKFIFTHSALREGWDNPNVFQICTLNETASKVKKRQELGRGLRIAVDQDGQRVEDRGVNLLTVVANESYEAFARQLQHELEEDTGIRFGVVERHQFASIPVRNEDGSLGTLGLRASEAIWQHLADKGYVDKKGKVQPALRRDLDAGTLDLPESAAPHAELVAAMLAKVATRLVPANADAEKRRLALNKERYASPEFLALWDRIKYRTTFRVEFDPEALVNACAVAIAKSPRVAEQRFIVSKSELEIDRGGVGFVGVAMPQTPYAEASRNFVIPDVVTYLQDVTNLTRRSIVAILRKSGRLADLARNPQRFVEQAVAIINHQKSLSIVAGIRYERIGDECYYVQELFEGDELREHLVEKMVPVTRSVHDHVVFDSQVEESLAQTFDRSEDVKVFAKLPRKFRIDTPLGAYNPDWAVLVERGGEQRLYFVLESKATHQNLRPLEQAKIDCGKAHFEALGTGVTFETVTNAKDFRDLLA